MKKRIQILIIVILYALMFVPLSAQTPHTISGIVKDRASVPISGVNIRVEGQKWKASTGKEGKFTLEIPQNSTITFSSVHKPLSMTLLRHRYLLWLFGWFLRKCSRILFLLHFSFFFWPALGYIHMFLPAKCIL